MAHDSDKRQSHHHGHSHDHSHTHTPGGPRPSSVGRLRLAFVLNLTFAVLELFGGWWTGSMAIVANSIHDFGDAATLLIALQLESRAQQSATTRYSYGFKRLSLLSAFLAGVVLIAGSLVVLISALERLFNSPELPMATGMMGFAVMGLVVNGLAAHRLHQGHTHNERILTWHMVEDILGWAAVLVGGILVKYFFWSWVDPILAIAVSGFVGWNAMRHLLKTIFVFMQGVPGNLDSEKLRSDLQALKGVRDVHDLHIWSLDGADHVMTLHARLAPEADPRLVKGEIRHLARHHGVFHTTIELEGLNEDCEENCDPDSDGNAV